MSSPLSDRYRTLRRLPDIPGSDCWLVQDEQAAQRLVIRDVPLDFFARDFGARFENEVQLLRLVHCENYNPLVSYAFQQDRLRMVYRYVDGFSLSRKLSTVFMSTRAALKLACDVLTALEQIHELGAVHRDLRPSHIVMCPSGPAVLSGYGPAWQASLKPANRPHCLETFRFASPELGGRHQARRRSGIRPLFIGLGTVQRIGSASDVQRHDGGRRTTTTGHSRHRPQSVASRNLTVSRVIHRATNQKGTSLTLSVVDRGALRCSRTAPRTNQRKRHIER